MTIHKNNLFTLILFCLLLVACDLRDSPPPPSETSTPEEIDPIRASEGSPFTLVTGQNAIIEGTGLTITFERVVEDGRCPSAVQCVETAPVIIQISAVQGDQTSTSFEMNPDPHFVQLSGIPPNIIDYQGYEIELTAVDPYPEQPEDNMNLPYSATFIVRKEG